MSDASFLLHNIADARFCSLHHNQTRHSSAAAELVEPSIKGKKSGLCVFKDAGCAAKNNILRPLPELRRGSLEEIETYFEYNEAVYSHSAGSIEFCDVAGKQACGTCRYVISKEADGTPPNVDNATLKSATDRCLVDCILYALDAYNQDSVFVRGSDQLRDQAVLLKKKVISPIPAVPTARFLPLSAVFVLRSKLNERSEAPKNVTNCAVESRIGTVLAAKNVHIFPLSRKFRCYAHPIAMSDKLQSLISLTKAEEFSVSSKERRKLLGNVSERFLSRKDFYRRGVLVSLGGNRGCSK